VSLGDAVRSWVADPTRAEAPRRQRHNDDPDFEPDDDEEPW
jgi:hypothetical protein